MKIRNLQELEDFVNGDPDRSITVTMGVSVFEEILRELDMHRYGTATLEDSLNGMKKLLRKLEYGSHGGDGECPICRFDASTKKHDPDCELYQHLGASFRGTPLIFKAEIVEPDKGEGLGQVLSDDYDAAFIDEPVPPEEAQGEGGA